MNTPQVTKLDNGLRIITEQVRDVDSVALSIRVGVGSRAESANQNGISHFLEHMAFKGTKTRTAFEIAKAFDDIGGVFNASTGRESTTYYAKVLKKYIKTGIDILIDILMNSTFPEDELEREKGVVIQEIFQTNDSPSGIVFDKYFEAAYKDQPFGKSILGTQDTVKSFTRENLNNYINEHYFGENMLFAVAGNVEHEEVVALTKDFLSKIHSKKLKKSQNATSYTGGEYLEHRKLDQVHLLIGLPSVSRYDDKYHTFQVLDSILGSGMSSRLFQEVREKQGLAYSVYSFNSSYTDTGVFSIFAGTDSSNLDKLLKSIMTELKKLSTDDLKEEEVNRVKERVKSQILMSREGVSSRAETLGHYYGNYNRYISKNELIEKISAVTTANVKKAAEELLSQHEKTTLAAIGEIKSLPSYDKVVSMLKA
ncbi:pitrilysin family protein [Wolbachia endosymbiont (group B) of Ennomos erosarius]|uniref:M16 family metallopeptidase n=1 Tax=Wolbachia endosymbiont (group B) of Ennomos erosarius TaxID=3066175 RepID=UPI003132D4E1